MSNRVNVPAFSAYLYRFRNLVECFFNKLKHFRAVATRYEKHDANYLAIVKLAAIQDGPDLWVAGLTRCGRRLSWPMPWPTRVRQRDAGPPTGEERDARRAITARQTGGADPRGHGRVQPRCGGVARGPHRQSLDQRRHVKRLTVARI